MIGVSQAEGGNMNTIEVLRAISSTEPSTFSEFCRGLSACPERGDKGAWAEVFDTLEAVETLGLIEIERDRSNRIETLILTDAGVARVKEARR